MVGVQKLEDAVGRVQMAILAARVLSGVKLSIKIIYKL